MTDVIIKELAFKAPTSILTTDINISDGYKQECLDVIYSFGDKMDRQTNLKADMSSYQVFNETKVLHDLIDKINIIAGHCPWIHLESYRYEIVDVWSGVYKKGDYAVSHMHHPAAISFCYYLKADPDKSAPLIFDGTDVVIRPYEGLCVFFPGYLIHSVPEQIHEDTRVVIAGNYNQIDMQKQGDSDG